MKQYNFKSDNYMGSNREKSIIAIAILEKFTFWKLQKLLCIFGAPILYSPTVGNEIGTWVLNNSLQDEGYKI